MPEKEIKKRHNLTLSDKAWQYLDLLKETNPNIKSRCAAIEFLIDSYIEKSNMELKEISKKTTMYLWTIYNKPIDYPDNVIVRKFAIVDGSIYMTGEMYICNSVDEARSMVPKDRVCIPRDPVDEPQIIETWI